MTAHLFVYGTLLPSEPGEMGKAERLRLQQEGQLIAPATTEGHLLNLGAYPGLVDGPGLVHGIVYRLPDVRGTLAWLDDYEGVSGASDDEYARRQRAVAFPSGALVLCWTYVFIQSKIDRPLIMSGSWYLRHSGQNAC